MLHTTVRALPVVLLAALVVASPLEQRAPVAQPGLLLNLLSGVLNGIQQLIKDVLTGAKSAISGEISNKPLICLQSIDKCCVWYDVSAELTKLFKEPNGQCNDNARAAIRFGFHDAGSWDKYSDHGGADGSLMMDFGEENRPENNGLQNIRQILRGIRAKYNVGYADLAQYAHNHGSISCPRGPRVRTLVGRKDATQAAPDGLLPDVHDSADNLIALFERKGFSAHDLAALVGAHSSSKQRFVDPSQAGKPLDTTPGIWDVEFYNDTLNQPEKNNPNIFVLPSDAVLSQHPAVNEEWREFVGNQPHWNEDYAKAYFQMSLNGVTNTGDLKDCTKTLPRTTFL